MHYLPGVGYTANDLSAMENGFLSLRHTTGVGAGVGAAEGGALRQICTASVGTKRDTYEGCAVGRDVGPDVGTVVGFGVGTAVGIAVGTAVGGSDLTTAQKC